LKSITGYQEDIGRTNDRRRMETLIYMKTIRQVTLIVFAALFWATTSFGQNQWTRQSPLPAARNLTGVAWATPTHGFASGESETLVETSDGGGTWHNVNVGISPSDPFYNVYCRDADNCFVIRQSAFV
jgi:photosystem II stability/assembly factor-like uncharacterized protein